MSTKSEMDDPIDDGAALATAGGDDFGDLDDTSQDDFGNDVEQDEAGEEPKPESEEEDQGGDADDDTEVETGESGESDEGEAETTESEKPADQQRIPKSRFDQVNERRKAAEARLKELERRRQMTDPAKAINFDFQAKEKEYMQHVLDGEEDKALAVREEIRSAEQTVMQERMRQSQQEATQQTKQQLELEQTIAEAQKDYPFFDGQSEQYDEAVTSETLELFEALKERYDPASAMKRAVNYTVKAHGMDTRSTTESDQSDEGPKPKPKPKSKSQGRSKGKTVDEKLKDAERQPPDVSGSQEVSDARDPMEMSEQEFDKLTEDEIRHMRGDIA